MKRKIEGKQEIIEIVESGNSNQGDSPASSSQENIESPIEAEAKTHKTQEGLKPVYYIEKKLASEIPALYIGYKLGNKEKKYYFTQPSLDNSADYQEVILNPLMKALWSTTSEAAISYSLVSSSEFVNLDQYYKEHAGATLVKSDFLEGFDQTLTQVVEQLNKQPDMQAEQIRDNKPLLSVPFLQSIDNFIPVLLSKMFVLRDFPDDGNTLFKRKLNGKSYEAATITEGATGFRWAVSSNNVINHILNVYFYQYGFLNPKHFNDTILVEQIINQINSIEARSREFEPLIQHGINNACNNIDMCSIDDVRNIFEIPDEVLNNKIASYLTTKLTDNIQMVKDFFIHCILENAVLSRNLQKFKKWLPQLSDKFMFPKTFDESMQLNKELVEEIKAKQDIYDPVLNAFAQSISNNEMLMKIICNEKIIYNNQEIDNNKILNVCQQFVDGTDNDTKLTECISDESIEDELFDAFNNSLNLNRELVEVIQRKKPINYVLIGICEDIKKNADPNLIACINSYAANHNIQTIFEVWLRINRGLLDTEKQKRNDNIVAIYDSFIKEKDLFSLPFRKFYDFQIGYWHSVIVQKDNQKVVGTELLYKGKNKEVCLFTGYDSLFLLSKMIVQENNGIIGKEPSLRETLFILNNVTHTNPSQFLNKVDQEMFRRIKEAYSQEKEKREGKGRGRE